MLQVQYDGKGQPYINVSNVRITLKQQGWGGSYRHITIRSYTGQGAALMMGPEIPINIPVTTLDDMALLHMIAGIFAAIA